jgi:hypothetical protein
MARQTKLGNPQGVTEWAALSTVGDAKRFIAWCIHSVRDQSMDTRTAATLGQLACYLMKAMETGDFDERLARIERALAVEVVDSDAGNQTTAH